MFLFACCGCCTPLHLALSATPLANMPTGLGASYRSLSDDVYKTTTVAENRFSVLESVKKAFSLAGAGSGPRRSEPLLSAQVHGQAQPHAAAQHSRDRKMPASTSAEETALLG